MNAIPEEGTFTEQQHADLRSEAKRVAKAEFSAMTKAAMDAGMAYSTFTAYLNDTYGGNNDACAADIQKWLRARKERAKAVLAKPQVPDFVMTPTAAKIIPILQYAQMAPDFAVIIGVPGIGKTLTLDHYRETNPNVWMATMEPASAKPGMMLREIARSMGMELKALGDASHEVKRRVKGTQGLLIIDEAQHLSVLALDQLRASIHDAAKIGVVVSGNEKLSALIGGSRKPDLAQLSSRVGMRVNLKRAMAGDVDALLKGWGVTDEGEQKWLRVIAGKPGALRGMTKVLTLASMLAAGTEEPRNLRHMQAAWAQLAGANELLEAA